MRVQRGPANYAISWGQKDGRKDSRGRLDDNGNMIKKTTWPD